MSWSNLIFLILSTIVTSLIAWGFAIFKAWLSSKIKDEKLKAIVLGIDDIIEKNVKFTYQTYVEALKNENIFNKENQKIALEKCKNLIINDLNQEMKDYILNNFGEITNWVITKIEEKIYNLKN